MTTLCVGMAVFEDTEGALSTIQHIRLCNQLLMGKESDRVSYLVIDNSPRTPSGRALADFMQKIGGTYVPLGDVKGTSVPRNAIFQHSKATYTLAMDSHIQLAPVACKMFLNWMDEHPEHHGDIVTGPLLNDEVWKDGEWQIMATHMDDQWRFKMWGTWGRAWQCKCGATTVSIPKVTEHATAISLTERSGMQPHVAYTKCVTCGTIAPDVEYDGHEKAFRDAGWKDFGHTDEGKWIEIPGMGLGLFGCKTDAWLGFPDGCRGFGAEEMNIHTKYRMNGHKAICIDFLKWWHRFFRPVDRTAPKVTDTIANHLEWDKELGLDRKELLHAHYVGGGFVSEEHWRQVLAGKRPQAQPTDPGRMPPALRAATAVRPQPPEGALLEDIFIWAQNVPRDLDQHLGKIRWMASQCKHVTEFSGRRESTVALLAALPEVLVSHNSEDDELRQTLRQAHELVQTSGAPRTCHWRNGDSLKEEIEETDMLFIDTVHSADRFSKELEKHHSKVRRWIVRHDTSVYGTTAEDGKSPGLAYAIKDFIEKHPEWYILSHDKKQFGLTVLARDSAEYPDMRPEKPITLWPKGAGPGTEFKRIMEQTFKVTMPVNCGCRKTMESMDQLGPDGVMAQIDTITKDIETRWKEWGNIAGDVLSKTVKKPGWFSSAVKAVNSGLAVELAKEAGWSLREIPGIALRPIPHLIKLAVKRAREKESSSKRLTCGGGKCKLPPRD